MQIVVDSMAVPKSKIYLNVLVQLSKNGYQEGVKSAFDSYSVRKDFGSRGRVESWRRAVAAFEPFDARIDLEL
jgi:hypothetical protein